MKKTCLLCGFLLGMFCFLSCEAGYTNEQISAYNYAYNKGITTVDSIEKAKMNGNITRIEMAKMVSNYAINVLGLKQDAGRNCLFYDVDPSINAQYDNGITKACQLGLMGLTDDGSIADYFNPNENVTRGQRATIFSRVLNKSRGEEIVEGDPYYRPHLKNLLKKGLIIDENSPLPSSNEKRGNVMIMMYRADPINTVTVNYVTGHTKLEAGQIYYNDYFDIEILSTRRLPWLVSVDEYYSDYIGTGGYRIELYNYVDEQFGNLKFFEDYEDYYKENGKIFGEDKLLMEVATYYIYDINELTSSYVDDGEAEGLSFCSATYLSDKYVIDDCPVVWQESVYEDVSGLKELLNEDRIIDFNSDELAEIQNIEEALDKYNSYLFSSYYDRFGLKESRGAEKLYSILAGDLYRIDDYYKDIDETRLVVEKTINEMNRFEGSLASQKKGLINKKSEVLLTGYGELPAGSSYYNSDYDLKIISYGYFPWYISGLSIYSFVPEKIGNLELTEDAKKSFSNNAEIMGLSGYLMLVRQYDVDETKCLGSYGMNNVGTTSNGYKICNNSKGIEFPYVLPEGTSPMEKLVINQFFMEGIGNFGLFFS